MYQNNEESEPFGTNLHELGIDDHELEAYTWIKFCDGA